MKNLLLFVLLAIFNFSCSQNKNEIIKRDLSELKKYIDIVYSKDAKVIKTYVVNPQNGKLYSSKTDDLFSEFNFNFENAYDIVYKDEKIVYIQKTPIIQSGDSAIYYGYYFNDEGKLIGAEKSVSCFCGNNGEILRYRLDYELNEGTDKLERVKEEYSDENEKKITNLDLIKNTELIYLKENLDKITFRDIEGFIKAEKIKYYK